MHEPPVLPMEPVRGEEPFTGEDYRFEVKWDGVRMLSFVRGGRLALQNRRGNPRPYQYPELGEIPTLLAADAVLDGEVVALKGGRPSFTAVMRRDAAASERAAASMVRSIPVWYMVFDLLWYGDRDTSLQPYVRRKELLMEVLRGGDRVLPVEDFADGLKLWEAVGERDLEGMVAKRKDSPYLFGRKTREWIKVKKSRRGDFVVGGYLKGGGAVSSLLLGLYGGDRLYYVGRAGSGIGGRVGERMLSMLELIHRPASPFSNLRKRPGAFWVEPRLTVLVEYLEWTGNLKLRAPVLVGGSAKSPLECQL